ncbi:type 1 glutamine amidotransferase domain-containing protein [Longimicrobium sp.]|uniref:type 1 glutamine amidotransferase domain-containing protein n=1 Tax=Longimicrobium sp. TaxID=2029185 RepID=UPI003B3AE3EE
MHHVDLTGLRVAVLAADGAEQVEITSPVEALEDHGAEVELVSVRPGRLRTVNHMYPGKKVRVNRTLKTADAEDYDALLLPGGLISPDTLRQNEQALDFVRAFDRAGKPIAVICHGPWLLISAGLVVRRNLTSWPGIRDDVRNAGGVYHDEPLIRDRNWVSSRGPHDLKHFNRGMLQLFAETVPRAPEAPEYTETRPRRKREGGLPLGRMLAGGTVAAGLVYLVAQQLRNEHEPEMEYVEVVDLEPDHVDLRADVEYDEDATLTGGYAGGMPYREGGPEYSTTGYLGSDGGGFAEPGYRTGTGAAGTAGAAGGGLAGDYRGGTGAAGVGYAEPGLGTGAAGTTGGGVGGGGTAGDYRGSSVPGTGAGTGPGMGTGNNGFGNVGGSGPI